jgi:hypothetical protein
VRFLECCSGKSGQPFIINEVDLDAAAFGWAAAAKSRSKAAHALKLARSERPSERQRRPCPKQGRLVHGAQRSAPRRGKDRLLLKNSSNGTVNAPPIGIWGVFEEETEGTFRRKIQAALF